MTYATAQAQTINFAGAQKNVISSGLTSPQGVALDASGNLYIADSANNRVVKETLSQTGFTQSVVATNLLGPTGVAVDNSGNVYIADTLNNQVLKETASGGAYTPSVVVQGLNLPAGVAVDGSGNVYVADTGNNRLLKETNSGGTYTQSVVASGLNQPVGIGVDASGNVFATDHNARVVKETLSNGSYTQSTLNAPFGGYNGVTVDGSGTVYAVDGDAGNVVTITAAGYQGVLRGSGTIHPWGVAVNGSGDVYVGDSGNNRIVDLMMAANFGQVNTASPSATVSLLFTLPFGGSVPGYNVLTKGQPNLDFADVGTGTCTTNGEGYSYGYGGTCSVDVVLTPRFAGTRAGAVVIIGSSGTGLATAYLNGTGLGPQTSFLPATVSSIPYNPINTTVVAPIAIDGARNIFIAESASSNYPGNALVEEVLTGSGYQQTVISTGFNYVTGIALDGAGNIFIADQDNQTIYEETPNGSGGYTQSKPFGTLGVLEGVATDPQGNVYVGSELLGLLKYTYSGGTWTRTVINSTEVASEISVDGKGNIYVASGTVYFLQPNGSYTAASFPGGRAVVADTNGNLYVDQSFGTSVYKDALNGNTYTQSVFATLTNSAAGIALDDSGNLYTSAIDGTLTKFDLADAPTLSFATTTIGSTSSDSPHTVTLLNSGNTPLIFPVPSSGLSPSVTTNFALNSGSGSACPQLGTSSSSNYSLSAEATCMLSISYSPTATTPTSGFVTLMDNSLNMTLPTYATQQISLGVTGSQQTPMITWTQPDPIVYGTQLSGVQLDATSSVAGTFVYTPAAGSVPKAGIQTLSVTLNPANTTQYASATTTTTLTVTQAKPSLTWVSPSAITYGTVLSSTQLNAVASVSGTYTYTPAAATVLTAGTQTLSVTFTPDDSVDYVPVSATVKLTVNAATPTILWPTPAAITYGTAIGPAQLDATANVNGTFLYSQTSGTVPNAGSTYISVTFTPNDTTDYTTATAFVYLTVNRATLTVNWATPATITYGTGLSSMQLDATASVPGFLYYSPTSGTVLHAGTNTLTVNFYANDTVDYVSPVTQTVMLTVNQTTPTITWATPTAISYGTPLSATQLNAIANVPGTFAYLPTAGTMPGLGASTLSVTFTPNDTKDYTTATQTVPLTVNQATPTVTWTTPAAITYGTALGASQLNATASVPGTYSYSPASGVVPGAGMKTLIVTFTPTDNTDYVSTMSSVVLAVSKAPLTINANSSARVYGAANPAFTGTVSGNVNGDTLTENFSTTATAASIVGIYPIVPSVTGANAADYVVTANNGSLTISQAGTSTTLALSNQNLTMTATVFPLTTGMPSGTVGFYEGQTLVGTGSVTNGLASYTASTFPSGDVVVSAEYSGDANFTQSSSPPILFLTVAPANSSLTVSRGSSVSDSLSLSVVPGYTGTVQFSCTGLPSDAACTFQPATVTFGGSASSATVSVTVATNTTSSGNWGLRFDTRGRVALALAMWLPAALLGFAMRRRKLVKRLNVLMVALALSCMTSALVGCAGNSSSQTPAGSYNLQIVATGSAGLTQSTSLTLTVQ